MVLREHVFQSWSFHMKSVKLAEGSFNNCLMDSYAMNTPIRSPNSILNNNNTVLKLLYYFISYIHNYHNLDYPYINKIQIK